MNTNLACPHCAAVLSRDPPGVLHCGACGKPYTIPGPDDLARMAKKREDEKRLFLLVGGVFFLVYVAPVLMVLGMGCISVVFYFVAIFAVVLKAVPG